MLLTCTSLHFPRIHRECYHTSHNFCILECLRYPQAFEADQKSKSKTLRIPIFTNFKSSSIV
jgi:hypothetical protein